MATTLFPSSVVSAHSSTSWVSMPLLQLLIGTRGSGVTATGNNPTLASLATSAADGGTIAVWESGGSSHTSTLGTGTGPDAYNINGFGWITDPLDPVTISGNITANIRALESNAMANYGVGCSVHKVAGGDGAATRIASALNSASELGTAEAARSVTLVPTSTALAAGDMLAVTFWYVAVGGTSASGFTAQGFYAGASGATGDSFVTFAETIALQSAAHSLIVPHRHRALIVR